MGWGSECEEGAWVRDHVSVPYVPNRDMFGVLFPTT